MDWLIQVQTQNLEPTQSNVPNWMSMEVGPAQSDPESGPVSLISYDLRTSLVNNWFNMFRNDILHAR